MSDPAPAEIEAGADALDPDTEMRPIAEATAERVLRAVLPDHDARIRAQVAEEIAQAIERDAEVSALGQYALGAAEHCAAIARAHATLTGEDT